MKRVTAMILAGGEGRRLAPLSDGESKPALSFGGGLRLVDFALMNLAAAGVSRGVALVQSASPFLASYLRNPPRELAGNLDLRVVQPDVDERYLGTADALARNLRFVDWTVGHVLVMPADLVARVDLQAALQAHLSSDADVTVVACRPAEVGRALFQAETAQESAPARAPERKVVARRAAAPTPTRLEDVRLEVTLPGRASRAPQPPPVSPAPAAPQGMARGERRVARAERVEVEGPLARPDREAKASGAEQAGGTRLRVDEQGRVVAWAEGNGVLEAGSGEALLSTGIYFFKRDALLQLLLPLSGPAPVELGPDVLAQCLTEYRVQAWRLSAEEAGTFWDVDTVQDYWSAQLAFLQDWRKLLPGGRLPRGLEYVERSADGRIVDAIVPTGLTLQGGEVRRAVLSPGVRLGARVTVVSSVLAPGVEVQDLCEARKAVVDRDARLTGEARVDPRRTRPGSQIRSVDGLSVVPRGLLVRGPGKIPRPGQSLPRAEGRWGIYG